MQIGRRRRSIGSQHALGLGRFGRTAEAIEPTILTLVERVTARMRAANRVGRTVVLRMRFEDYARATRSHTLPWPTAQTEPILEAVRALLEVAMPTIRARGLTMVGVAVQGLQSRDAAQLALPFERERNEALDAVVDAVRARFGSRAIVRAALLGHDPSWSAPTLPD